MSKKKNFLRAETFANIFSFYFEKHRTEKKKVNLDFKVIFNVAISKSKNFQNWLIFLGENAGKKIIKIK